MRSVLIVKPGSMGDVIHALPVANALHTAWPDASLTWIVDPRWAPLLEGHPAIDRVVEFPRENFRGVAGAFRFLRWVRGLKELRPELAIDLQGLLRSAVLTKAARPGKTIGLSDAREGSRHCYSQVAEVSSVRHAVDRYCQVLPLLNVQIPAEKMFFPEASKHSVSSELPASSPKRPLVVLHPFARGEGKSLTAPALAALVSTLESSADLTVVGHGPLDLSSQGLRNLTNKTSLPELRAILATADFVISADSGPMHLAAALGRPVLGIHTWSDPSKVGPYSSKAWVWQGGEIRAQDFAFHANPEKPFTETSAREVGEFVTRVLKEKSRVE